MKRLSRAAGVIAALALGAPPAVAQWVAPGYVLEKEHFSSAPPSMPGRDDIEAPGQDVPGTGGQTHAAGLRVPGRGGAPQRPRVYALVLGRPPADGGSVRRRAGYALSRPARELRR